MKKGFRLAVCLLLALALAGCASILPADTEKLLRAPRPDGETGAVQQAVNSYLGESVQLKFPATGEYLSPFLFGDWNGDGRQDAAVLFTAASLGQNVNLALLEQDDAHQWRVIAWTEGLAAEVNAMTVAGMDETSASQILVGYGNRQTGLYLAVYALRDGVMETLFQQTYSQLLLADLSGSGSQDLILVMPEDQEGTVELQILTSEGEQFHVTQQITVGSGVFSSCAKLTPGVDVYGEPYLVVDGFLSGSGSGLASVILIYDQEGARLRVYQTDEVEDFAAVTQRYNAVLTSRDLNQDGSVEIPKETSMEIAPELEHRAAALGWVDYTQPEPQITSFGVWDTEYNFFMPLPQELQETACLEPGEMGWRVCNRETGETYLYVRVAYPTQSRGGYTRVAYIGAQQIQVKVGAPYPGLNIHNITTGTVIL